MSSLCLVENFLADRVSVSWPMVRAMMRSDFMGVFIFEMLHSVC